MKRIIFSLFLIILLTSIASAEIIIKEQPKELYNLGEVLRIPVKISTSSAVEDFFSMKLICNGIENEIHKQYVSIPIGGEQEISAAIPLSISFLGRTTGTCTIKSILGTDFILSKEFKISDLIKVTVTAAKPEFAPGENIIVEGTAIKENGENAQGFVDLSLVSEDETTVTSETVKNGYYSLNISLPKNAKAGQYLIRVNVYEKLAEGNITNSGVGDMNILVSQVPTSLEIAFDTSKVEPGTSLLVKAILHDQSGEKITSNAILTLKNDKDKILKQVEIATEEFFEYPIVYNEKPNQWKIIATSNKLSNEEAFSIIEKESAKIEIINGTVIITNTGNVPYNETVLIKVGEEPVEITTYMEVDGIQKYTLSAPDGEYVVSVSSGGAEASESVMLTGSVIGVSEAGGILSAIKMPFVWIFMIAILGFMTFLVYKKGYKRVFIGYITKRKEKKAEKEANVSPRNILVNPKNKAELSLSIKGDNQTVSMVCLKIKNPHVIDEAGKRELQSIADVSDEGKASVYEAQGNLFFIFAPIRTKTYHNQKTSIEFAQKIKDALNTYNQTAKEKIQFGLAANFGSVVAKYEKEILKFMSLGTLMTGAKKLANVSDGDVYLTSVINEKVLTEVKTEKIQKQGVEAYAIKEIRHRGEDNKKFISNFVRKLEAENKENKAKEEERKRKLSFNSSNNSSDSN